MTVPLQPRAQGAARIAVRDVGGGRTGLSQLRQQGCSKLLLPRPHGAGMQAILVNTAGGVTGGDRLALEVEVGPGARLSLTTQAAERVYRAQPGEVGEITSEVAVGAGGCLHWLPQELILFNHCALHRRLDIDVAADATLLMVEPVVFGRAAMAETLTHAYFQDRIRITRDGVPIYVDGMNLAGDVAQHLALSAVAGGAGASGASASGAMASVVLVASDAQARLAQVRALLDPSPGTTAGASLLAPDTLVLRMIATDSYDLRKTLMPVLERLSDTPLPTSWRL